VAIAAVDAVIADVVLMTELNWLLPLDVLAGVPARPQNLRSHPECGEQNEGGAENRCAREIVCAVTKYLWHRRRSNSLKGGLFPAVQNRRGPCP